MVLPYQQTHVFQVGRLVNFADAPEDVLEQTIGGLHLNSKAVPREGADRINAWKLGSNIGCCAVVGLRLPSLIGHSVASSFWGAGLLYVGCEPLIEGINA